MADKDDHYFSPQVNTKTNRAEALFQGQVRIEGSANTSKKAALSVQTNIRGGVSTG